MSATRDSPASALIPTVAGVHLNSYGGYAFIDLAVSSSGGGIIDFTTVGTYMKGRLVYRSASSQFEWMVDDTFTAKMTFLLDCMLVQHWYLPAISD